jgi:hypothetical protein
MFHTRQFPLATLCPSCLQLPISTLSHTHTFSPSPATTFQPQLYSFFCNARCTDRKSKDPPACSRSESTAGLAWQGPPRSQATWSSGTPPVGPGEARGHARAGGRRHLGTRTQGKMHAGGGGIHTVGTQPANPNPAPTRRLCTQSSHSSPSHTQCCSRASPAFAKPVESDPSMRGRRESHPRASKTAGWTPAKHTDHHPAVWRVEKAQACKRKRAVGYMKASSMRTSFQTRSGAQRPGPCVLWHQGLALGHGAGLWGLGTRGRRGPLLFLCNRPREVHQNEGKHV